MLSDAGENEGFILKANEALFTWLLLEVYMCCRIAKCALSV